MVGSTVAVDGRSSAAAGGAAARGADGRAGAGGGIDGARRLAQPRPEKQHEAEEVHAVV